MAFDHDGKVGDFRRSVLRKVFDEYREILQGVLDDVGADETTKASLKKQLARLEGLKNQWTTGWFQLGLGQAPSAREQDERESALLRIEAQLAKECPNIFKLSYYVPVRTSIRDDMEI
jgi:hypothetical protein